MSEKALIKIHGYSGVEVKLTSAFLADLNRAYEAVCVCLYAFDGMARPSIGLVPMFLPYYDINRTRLAFFSQKAPTRLIISASMLRSQQLVLNAVRLNSPGFWEFLGGLNPLEVMRKYISDRHERRKDKEYRESAEERRLSLENLKIENEILAERIRLAKQIGATDQDLAPLLNNLIFKPLSRLDKYQDKRVIENAEIIKVSGKI